MKKYKYHMKHHWIGSQTIGKLHPCFMQEVTPGDTWSGYSTSVFRLDPLDVPTYMGLKIFTKFFFVPYRLLWDDFEDYMTGQNPSAVWPTIDESSSSTLMLNMGLIQNNNTVDTIEHNALPVRAYNKIWNDMFRPHLHISEVAQDSLSIQRVYFPESEYYGSIKQELQQDTVETVDSSGATIPITEIRDAFNAQRLKERRSQYGERYRDMLATDYGVRAPDSRLDRPELLAKSNTTLGISEVVTTATSATEPSGQLRGHGIAGQRTNFPKRYFTEHGIIMGVTYVRPRMLLRERVDHIFHTQDKEDLYIPSAASDTMITIKANEVYPHGSGWNNNFGYMDKYDHLRMARDTLAGQMTFDNFIPWSAHVELSSIPTVSFLQQVQDYDLVFQDQSPERVDMKAFYSHNIGKTSIIKPRNRR